MPRATIVDVAKLAGVSTATVSHVINNTRFVTADTRQKVHGAIDALNYQPLASARSLVKMETRLVGVVLPDINNPFFVALYKGIEASLTNLGYDLILANTDEDIGRQETILKALYGRQVDGLIIAPCGRSSEMLYRMEKDCIPIVVVDRIPPNLGYPKVIVNNEEAACQAVTHLIEDGHKRIGFVGGLGYENISLTPVIARKRGYLRALQTHGIEVREAWIHTTGKALHEDSYNRTLEIFTSQERPTALFATNIPSALGILHALRKLNLRCPKDVGLVSFDDHDWTDIFSPPISTVRQPASDLGITAAELLLRMINQPEDGVPIEDATLKCQLIVRGSCSPACLARYSESN